MQNTQNGKSLDTLTSLLLKLKIALITFYT